jgi:hypothetical protein
LPEHASGWSASRNALLGYWTDYLTLICARGIHRESMPANIIGALL